MTTGFLTPDTQNALLQASQSGSGVSNKSLRDAKHTKAIEQAAIEFEAVFISEMMKPMFEGTQADAPFHGGQGEDIFKSMMLQEYGSMISKTGSIGVSSTVKDMMIKMQGGEDEPLAAMNGDTLGASTQNKGTDYASVSSEALTPEQLNAIEPGTGAVSEEADALSQIINSLTTQP
jgi:flagellar protein FlgJ